ncbi:MAG: zinc-binding dehydrogenase, partial [Cyclobacteriaceae bacterium]|nr:zinc-binding dehydrogenase [Cyclobacteriaceae bacterium]
MFGVISQMAAQMDFLKGLVETGHYVPVVDRAYALKDMAEAHRYIEGGHKKGNVPIVVAESK